MSTETPQEIVAGGGWPTVSHAILEVWSYGLQIVGLLLMLLGFQFDKSLLVGILVCAGVGMAVVGSILRPVFRAIGSVSRRNFDRRACSSWNHFRHRPLQ